jgi:hypothetical protein
MRKMSVVVVTFLALAALAACGGGSSAKSSDTTNPAAAPAGNGGDTSTTAPFGGGGSASQLGSPTGKIRVANLLTVNGAPGPAMDLYDIYRPKPGDAPLIKDLKYGEISGYVSPHAPSPDVKFSNLYMYPAGTLTTTDLLSGSNLSQVGYQEGDQLTLAIIPSDLAFAELQITEAGPNMPPTAGITPPSGKGVLLVESAATGDSSTLPLQFLMVDTACPLSTGSTIPASIATGEPSTVLPVAPGHHTLGVVTSPPGRGLVNCNGKTPSGTTTTVDVSAGEQIDTFVYGDPANPKILTAPVSR